MPAGCLFTPSPRTAGNGFAFLKLFTRTGDEVWLERARRFAKHAARQVATTRERYGRGRHTLGVRAGE